MGFSKRLPNNSNYPLPGSIFPTNSTERIYRFYDPYDSSVVRYYKNGNSFDENYEIELPGITIDYNSSPNNFYINTNPDVKYDSASLLPTTFRNNFTVRSRVFIGTHDSYFVSLSDRFAILKPAQNQDDIIIYIHNFYERRNSDDVEVPRLEVYCFNGNGKIYARSDKDQYSSETLKKAEVSYFANEQALLGYFEVSDDIFAYTKLYIKVVVPEKGTFYFDTKKLLVVKSPPVKDIIDFHGMDLKIYRSSNYMYYEYEDNTKIYHDTLPDTEIKEIKIPRGRLNDHQNGGNFISHIQVDDVFPVGTIDDLMTPDDGMYTAGGDVTLFGKPVDNVLIRGVVFKTNGDEKIYQSISKNGKWQFLADTGDTINVTAIMGNEYRNLHDVVVTKLPDRMYNKNNKILSEIQVQRGWNALKNITNVGYIAPALTPVYSWWGPIEYKTRLIIITVAEDTKLYYKTQESLTYTTLLTGQTIISQMNLTNFRVLAGSDFVDLIFETSGDNIADVEAERDGLYLEKSGYVEVHESTSSNFYLYSHEIANIISPQAKQYSLIGIKAQDEQI